MISQGLFRTTFSKNAVVRDSNFVIVIANEIGCICLCIILFQFLQQVIRGART